jgi:hypothetical protein
MKKPQLQNSHATIPYDKLWIENIYVYVPYYLTLTDDTITSMVYETLQYKYR